MIELSFDSLTQVIFINFYRFILKLKNSLNFGEFLKVKILLHLFI